MKCVTVTELPAVHKHTDEPNLFILRGTALLWSLTPAVTHETTFYKILLENKLSSYI